MSLRRTRRVRPAGEAGASIRSSGGRGGARGAEKFFIGEFGDESGATPFIRHTLDDIARDKVDDAAVWVWEFCQHSTDTLAKGSLEPGFTDPSIAFLGEATKRLGGICAGRVAAAPRRRTTAPPYKATFDPAGLPARAAEIEARVIAASGAAAFRIMILPNEGTDRCNPSG